MLSPESGPVLHLTPSPSVFLLLAGSLVHVAALCSAGMIELPVAWQVVLLFAIWLSGVNFWFRHWQQPRVQLIEWHSMERIILHSRQQTIVGTLHKVHCLYPWLISFSVRSVDGRLCPCLLLKDQIDPDAFRRLAVRLRFAHTDVADAA